jgi:hypothetical protein
MSTSWQRNVERHTKAQESTLGEQVFTWSGTDYLCTPNMEDAGETIDDHGNYIKYQGKLRVRVSLFADALLPAKGDDITIDEEDHKVAHVGKLLPSGLAWIYLIDVSS